ncbi:ervatamin-B-like [Phragmites australis]|uniref:ervatamin-B-like n=1 Tax=Phragmites australis TaxID=29695 RepID=UPI002D798A71|nr:ervatamin-B-like [Phragmites australis]
MAPAAASSSLALALLCACLLAGAALGGRVDVGDMLMMDRFRTWQAEHNRMYATATERLRRFEVYRRNVEYIEATNRRGGLSYELGENQFTDLTSDEFRAMYTMSPGQVVAVREAMQQLITTRAGPVGEGRNSNYSDDYVVQVPDSVDWRTKGAVTPVKNQYTCGSCWAFSTVASIEGLHKINTGHLVSLSEQELVDCSHTPPNDGCEGGLPSAAMEWIARNGGLTTESDYPYENKQGKCKLDKTRNHAVKIRGGKAVEPNNEDALERAVARQPVTVLINASAGAFQHYKSGVLSGTCDPIYDHAVTAVGYGADAGGRKYWIVKNSWGETWGEKGYVRMERRINAKEGMCGIAIAPHYPVM